MKRTSVKFTRYEDDGFYIDIIRMKDSLEAYISHKDYGISELMFGAVTYTSDSDFLEMVKRNLESYKDIYKQQYFEN